MNKEGKKANFFGKEICGVGIGGCHQNKDEVFSLIDINNLCGQSSYPLISVSFYKCRHTFKNLVGI